MLAAVFIIMGSTSVTCSLTNISIDATDEVLYFLFSSKYIKARTSYEIKNVFYSFFRLKKSINQKEKEIFRSSSNRIKNRLIKDLDFFKKKIRNPFIDIGYSRYNGYSTIEKHSDFDAARREDFLVLFHKNAVFKLFSVNEKTDLFEVAKKVVDGMDILRKSYIPTCEVHGLQHFEIREHFLRQSLLGISSSISNYKLESFIENNVEY